MNTQDDEWQKRIDRLPEPEERIIFLDIDGVLNSADYFERTHDEREGINRSAADFWQWMFDPDAVTVLNTIIQKTDAKCVLSSSWRHAHTLADVRGLLKGRGFIGSLIDKTPKRAPNPPYRRGNEIQAWLAEHPEVKKFVILDDDSDMEHLMPYLVQTSWRDGLKTEHIVKVLKVLE